jgi:hypothetical protein
VAERRTAAQARTDELERRTVEPRGVLRSGLREAASISIASGERSESLRWTSASWRDRSWLRAGNCRTAVAGCRSCSGAPGATRSSGRPRRRYDAFVAETELRERKRQAQVVELERGHADELERVNGGGAATQRGDRRAPSRCPGSGQGAGGDLPWARRDASPASRRVPAGGGGDVQPGVGGGGGADVVAAARRGPGGEVLPVRGASGRGAGHEAIGARRRGSLSTAARSARSCSSRCATCSRPTRRCSRWASTGTPVQAIDPAAGKWTYPCLISLKVGREDMPREGAPLRRCRHVPAPAWGDRLAASVRTRGDRTDRGLRSQQVRLRTGMDAVATLDSRPNLLDMSPSNIERLVRQFVRRPGC